MEEKDMAYLHAILGKIATILKWLGSQKDPLFTLTLKDPIKIGYLSHNVDLVGTLEEKVVHR